jgi:hypothetical protein
MEETLGFLALLVTALGLVSLAAWFFSSAVLSLASTRRGLKDEPRYGALLKENERLRSHLAQAEEDNARFRELYGYRRSTRRCVASSRGKQRTGPDQNLAPNIDCVDLPSQLLVNPLSFRHNPSHLHPELPNRVSCASALC